MFSFEAGMKHFKKLFHGTTHYGHQIVEKFLLYKYLFFEVSTRQDDYPIFATVLKDLGITTNDKDGFISVDRYRINGMVYHSSNYDRKCHSVSFLCFLKNCDFCEILSLKNNNIDEMTVKIFEKRTLVTYFSTELFCE